MAEQAKSTIRIRMELRGGLGNQFFQAAAALSLAKRLKAQLQFELFTYRSESLRGYALSPFPLGADLINTRRTPLARVLRHLGKALPDGWLMVAPAWGGDILQERDFAYDERIEQVSGDCYLRGYFQSWRYFAHDAAMIRQLFDPQLAASPVAKDYAASMGDNALSIHVRAGDFLLNPKANQVHGTLGSEYYANAIRLARESGYGDKVFCFSDNIDHARKILEGAGEVIFVEGFSQYDDLYLMSCARGHIIANSSFSYWAAWLDDKARPLVIAPRAWFAPNYLKKTYIGDLHPPGWVLI